MLTPSVIGLQVLDLQTRVTSIRAPCEKLGREVELKDICFKPLESVSDECGVFSPMEYFQSNASTFKNQVCGPLPRGISPHTNTSK